MRCALRLAFTAALLSGAAAVACAQPPATRTEVARDTLHGVVIEDPYRWLEDQSSAETRAWVRDQMAWTRAQLAQAPGREALVSTLSRFSKVDTRSMPRVVAGRQFFTTRKADQQQDVLVMKRAPNAPDEVLVDANPLSEDHSVSVSLVDVSRDGKWIAYGGSNGGLLVGAAMTQRPDLFGAVVCSLPLLDMLRYQDFLVARFWVPEYGSSEDPAQFQWLRAYSPYHHVRPGVKYPAVMFVSGDSDTRVAPLHARKMAALMQAQHGEQPVLLHYDAESGHSRGKSVDRGIEDLADELQFLRWRLGLTGAAR